MIETVGKWAGEPDMVLFIGPQGHDICKMMIAVAGEPK